MDLMKIGTDLLMSKLGVNNADGDQLSQMLAGLLGGGESLDLGGLLSSLQSGGAAEAASSWLGSGENQPLDTGVLAQALDGEKLSNMASHIGLDQGDLLGGLADAIPQLIDKASPNGELLDVGQLLEGLQGGDAGDLMGAVGKLFGR